MKTDPRRGLIRRQLRRFVARRIPALDALARLLDREFPCSNPAHGTRVAGFADDATGLRVGSRARRNASC